MNKIYKAVLAAAAVTVVATAVITPVSVIAWGDSANGRPSYTIEEINAGKLGDKITINSISNGNIGNEKNFVSAALTSSNKNWGFNEVNVKDGEEYTVYMYVHNTNPNGTKRVAENVKASVSIPTQAGKTHTITGHITSSNADPDNVWDEVTFKSDSNFTIEYVFGSAKYTNQKLGTVALSDNIITSDVLLGYDKLDGKLPGCYQYSGYVTFKVKIRKSVAASLEKFVRIKGSKDWVESVNAKVGDQVEFKINYKNMLDSKVTGVMVADDLPKNIEYVKGTTYLYNPANPNGKKVSDNLTSGGINIGNYDAGSGATLVFTGKVVDKTLVCGKTQNVNWASTTINGDSKNIVAKDDASVFVTKSCPDPGPDPKPDPEPTPTPTPPTPTPDPGPLPNTGANEVVVSALGVGVTVTAAGYYIASRKKLVK